MDEAEALIATLESTAPDGPTACVGWTAHDLVAHLAAGAAEMAELTEDAVAGRPSRPTRDFGEREAPFVAMADDALRDRLFVEALRLTAAVEALQERGPDASVPFAGRALTPGELSMHGRSEVAIHRWDLAGDDPISIELLSQPELTAHAVSVLTTMTALSMESVAQRAAAAEVTQVRANFASPGQPDVVVVCDAAGPRFELAEASTSPTASSDPATRLLALWGRRSTIGVIRWSEDSSATGPLRAVLWGTHDASSLRA